MTKYLAMMMTVSTVFLIREGSEESLAKRDELWEFLEKSNKNLYKAVRRCFLGRFVQLKGKMGNLLIMWGYQLSRKIYGFS
jgi:hypothetical protein